MEFLSLYVAEEPPEDSALTDFAPVLYSEVGATAKPVEPIRFVGESYDEALAGFEEDTPRVRILFENGAAPGVEPGSFGAVWEIDFDSWPPPDTEATPWYLGPDGTLTTDEPTGEDEFDAYEPDPTARPETSLPGDENSDAWAAQPAYDWKAPVDGNSLSYISEALGDDTVMVGTASVDLWARSSEPDVDFQVTISEVTPEGKEIYVQSGWLRASHRHLDEDDSTDLNPRPTHLEKDSSALPSDEFVPVRIQVFTFGHVFREGSQIRLVIQAPGGDRPRWKFDTKKPPAGTTVEIARDEQYPSRIVMPVIAGIDVDTPLPACGALRGQPCRDYVAPRGSSG
jgi:predicted acyl esterase